MPVMELGTKVSVAEQLLNDAVSASAADAAIKPDARAVASLARCPSDRSKAAGAPAPGHCQCDPRPAWCECRDYPCHGGCGEASLLRRGRTVSAAGVSVHSYTGLSQP